MQQPAKSKQLSSTEIVELERLLQTLTGALSLVEAHGLLAAVACAPSLLMPDDWRPQILGRTPGQPAERAFGLLVRLSNQIAGDLARGKRVELPGDFDEQTARRWCAGYLRGAALDQIWQATTEAAEQLRPLRAFAEGGEPLSAEQIVEQVEGLYEYWARWRREKIMPAVQAHTAATAPRKVGRNDKCPCGSGKKYKRCCGQA